MNPKTKGYICAAISAASYGTNPLFALPLYSDGMDTNSVLFFRYAFALILLYVMIKARGRNLKTSFRAMPSMLLLGVLMAISSITLFQSYNYMEAGIASTILFVYPIMVAIIMAVFYKERVSMQTVVCISLALIGIVLLYHGKGEATLSITGMMLVLASSLSYAIYIVLVNRPPVDQVPTIVMTFYILLVGLTIFFISSHFGADLQMPHHPIKWINVLALAAFPTCVSFVCITYATQYIGATQTAILGALEPVTAVFFGVTVFGETLTMRIVSGMLLILLAVTLIIAGGNVSATLIRFRKMFPRVLKKR